MNKRILVLAMTAWTAHSHAADLVDTAQVVSSVPIYDRVSEPKQECWNEVVNAPAQEHAMGGAVVGGVAGGLLGSTVGGGNGNKAAAAAGAIAGTIIGDRNSNPDSAGRPIGGSLLGGIMGGILGHQVGGGNGNTAATAVGAAIGAMVGDRMENPTSSQAHEQTVKRCRQVENYREVVRGYNVTYRYNGRDITTRLPYDPGSSVQVSVAVMPDNRGAAVQYREPEKNTPTWSDNHRSESNRRDDWRYRD
jgi:uncharacterized protein YcfJ